MIGYDSREHDAWEVCRASLLRRSSIPLNIVALDQEKLRTSGLYRRKWFRAESGQRIDSGDGKPFSTDFTFSRFLVPVLSVHQGWALFCDCDFLFTADIAELFALAEDQYAVMCVKHEHDPNEALKMDGEQQTRYRRKNWSSLVLWNCSHQANDCISVDCVNKMPGQWLHAFDWLQDEQIGTLPGAWNWLSGVDRPLVDDAVPCGIHYTLGIPTMAGHEHTPYADLWRAELESRRHLANGPLPSERLRAIEATEEMDMAMKRHMTYGSPSSKQGSMIGAGYQEGAGQTPAVGPGRAAARYRGISMDENMSSAEAPRSTPKGMHVYKEGGGA